MKIENYNFFVNENKVTFEEWIVEFRKLYRTDRAYELSKKELLDKIENGVENWNWKSKLENLHLKIERI